jgi:hypothetical protein
MPGSPAGAIHKLVFRYGHEAIGLNFQADSVTANGGVCATKRK